MLLNIKTYDGVTLNDSNYAAWFPFGQPMSPRADAEYAARSWNYPLLAGKTIRDTTLSFNIACKGTFHVQYDYLKALFSINDHTPRALVAEDAADSNRQWYAMGYAVEPLAPAGQGYAGEYVVTLALLEPFWRGVTKSTDTLAVDSSGDSKALTILGNIPARPKITMTIGGARSGSYSYRKWLPIYHPLATAANNEALELTSVLGNTGITNQLNGALTAIATTFAVDTSVGGGLATGGGIMRIDNELINYSGIAAGTVTVAASGRGYAGTTAAAHLDNSVCKQVTNGWDTTALIADTSKSNQINQFGGISASELSIPIDTSVGGGLLTTGGMCYVGTEQILYTSISAGVMTVASNGRGYGGTTAATHADDAVMVRSQMMANCQDVRVQINKSFADIWIYGANTTATKVWATPKFEAACTLPLAAAISNAGSVASITFAATTANLAALKRLPQNASLLIDNELFYASAVSPTTYKITIAARAQKGTVAANHAVAATVRWLDKDIWLLWGKPSEEAQAVDDTRKPIFSLASTNYSLTYAEFATDAGTRTGEWRDAVIRADGAASSTPSHLYTDTQDASADPAAVIGMAAKAYVLNGVTKAENFDLRWTLYHPAGFMRVTASGFKRRTSTTWSVFTFNKSLLGTTLVVVWTEATPASASSWAALTTHSNVTLVTSHPYLVMKGAGSITAVSGNENDMEFTDFTGDLSIANLPQANMSMTTEDGYYLDATLSITETADALTVSGTCKVGSVIVIDCEAETVTTDGVEGGIGIAWNTVRNGWLDLPGTAQEATCTLVYTETGVSNVALALEWENRAAL